MFSLAGVEKRYAGKTVLGPLDLQIPGGLTLVLLGPSGCGKSTLLRLLLGLLTPDAGEVRWDGQAVGPARFVELRRQLGYVVQGGGLFPHLTAGQNVTLVARRRGWDRPRVDRRVEELLALTRLEPPVLERYPLQLSGGQAQRVSLMRALMQDPQVLLLDEPLGALDPITRFELQQDLREVFRRLARTVVLVTHDLGEAAFFADEVAVLREGQIVQRGQVRTLLEAPADPFVTRFVTAQRSPLEELDRR